MTQEDKDLLLKDLCGRIPYGVKLDFYAKATQEHYICTIKGVVPEDNEPIIALTDSGNFSFIQEHIKPYLFPLSSMTEEQKEIYCILQDKVIYNSKGPTTEDILDLTNWLDENMFDWRVLIPIGLAIDATGLNIYN